MIGNKGMEIDHRLPEEATTNRTAEVTTTASTMVAVTDSVEATWIAADIQTLAEEDLEEAEEVEVVSHGTTKVEMEEDSKTTGMVALPNSILVQQNHFNRCAVRRKPKFKRFSFIQTSTK